ncbi:MAG: hypothetical protein ACM31C_17855 [Acidobacteriota bacterium]
MRAWGMLLLAGCTIHVAGPAAPPGPPPPARQEVVIARAGFVWVQGRWQWQGQWVWIGGHWERARAMVVQTTTAPPPPHDPEPLEVAQPPPAATPGRAVIAWSAATISSPEIYVEQWDGRSWRELGGSGHGGGISNTPTTKVYGVGDSAVPAVALDASGYPVVAWTERIEVNHYPLPHGESTIARDEIYVRRWNGVAWVELAGSGHGVGISNSRASGSDSATYPAIAIDHAGRIVVAWQEADLRHGNKLWIAVRRWDGRAWQDLGGSSARFGISGDGVAGAPSLAIDAEDRAVVAWSASTERPCAIAVKRWSGSAWEPLAGSADPDGISGAGGTSDPSLALDRRGNAVVIWPLSGNPGFGARRWDGRAWQTLTTDPKAQSCTAGLKFGLTIDAQGAPIVAEHELGKHAALRVARWTGSTWATLPSPGQGGGTVALATGSDGDVVATWAENGIHAARWDGRAWHDLGLVTTSDRAEWPRVAAP